MSAEPERPLLATLNAADGRVAHRRNIEKLDGTRIGAYGVIEALTFATTSDVYSPHEVTLLAVDRFLTELAQRGVDTLADTVIEWSRDEYGDVTVSVHGRLKS